MTIKRTLILLSLLMLIALPANANVLKETGTVCFADGNSDGFSEEINFPNPTSNLLDIFPDDPLGQYVGFDATCGMEKSYSVFPNLSLTSEISYYPTCEDGGDVDCDECFNSEMPLTEGVYPEAYKLYVLDSTTCSYVEVLRMDIIIKNAPLSNWCPKTGFAFEFNHSVINNFIDSPLLDYYASQPECPYSWGYVEITSDDVFDFGAKIKDGEDFCADAKFFQFPGVACSGCDDCGVESNGRMATAMSKRHYLRGQSAVCSDPSGEGVSCEKLMRDPQRSKNSATAVNLEMLFPDFESLNLQAFPSTPEHLADITNARDLIAMDHFKDGTTNGAILLLETTEQAYEHSKTICDRVSGEFLEYVTSVRERGMTFPVAVIHKGNDQKRSFAVTIVVADGKVYSHLRLDEYPKFEGKEVYNIQLWACSPIEMQRILKAELEKLEEVFGTLTYDTRAKNIPDAYIMSAKKTSRNIDLRMSGVNEDKQLRLVGRYWPEENSGSSQALDIAVPTGTSMSEELPNFIDMDAKLVDADGNVYDQIYLSDGEFSAFDDSEFGDGNSSSKHDINNYCKRSMAGDEDDLIITGCGTLVGSIDGYGAIIRPMLGGNSPWNLNTYESVAFNYKSNVDLVMCIESKSRYGLSQNCVSVAANKDWEDIEINLADFELYQEGKPAILDDIVAISWNAWNPDKASGQFDVNYGIQSVLFKKTADVAATEASGCNQTNAPATSAILLISLLTLVALRRKNSLNL